MVIILFWSLGGVWIIAGTGLFCSNGGVGRREMVGFWIRVVSGLKSDVRCLEIFIGKIW